MKRYFAFLLLFAASLLSAQTYTYPTLQGNNAFTGNESHSGTETFNTIGAKSVTGILSVVGYGADPTGVTDSSAAFASTWALAKVTGGEMIVPPGTYMVYLDISGCTPPTNGPVVIRGYGATLIPSSSATHSTIIYGNDSGCSAGYGFTVAKLIGFTLQGQAAFSGTYSPTLQYLVYLNSMAIESERNTYLSAQIDGLYGEYVQYLRSQDDYFTAGNYSTTTAGVWITGHVSGGSNEVSFLRPRFNTNSIGASINGGAAIKLYGPQFQNNFQYGMTIGSDLAGACTNSIKVDNFYSENNGGPTIQNNCSQYLTIDSGEVEGYNTGGNWFVSAYTGNLSVKNVRHPYSGATVTFTYNQNPAALVWENNTANPTITTNGNPNIQMLVRGSGGANTWSDTVNPINITTGSNLNLTATGNLAATVGGTATITVTGSLTLGGANTILKTTNSGGTVYWYPGTSAYAGIFSGAFTASRYVNFPDGNSSLVLTAGLTTTAATSDNVTIQGMTSSGHCSMTATNASAATNIATSYISAKAANQITVTHVATSGMAYDIKCTAN